MRGCGEMGRLRWCRPSWGEKGGISATQPPPLPPPRSPPPPLLSTPSTIPPVSAFTSPDLLCLRATYPSPLSAIHLTLFSCFSSPLV